ncbi:hypothetical protein Vadar_020241 [Vaccinium darrowii]|uniref:Uncharacterized protein n=1 Tax=Vaccinium darrowii TaxID=229202 RepID=A0ACB7XBB8_9ERIC|nr:hypothetical protein Vadar_020241 [Vaccinium darrowii]
MGCFLACFGSSKDKKPRSQIKNRVLPQNQQRHGIQKPQQSNLNVQQEISAKPTNLVQQEISAKPTNLISEEVPFMHSDHRYKVEEQLSLSTRKKVTFDVNVKAYEPVSVQESAESLPESGKDIEQKKGDNSGKSSLSRSQSEDDSTTSSVLSFPPNHRYQNCRDSDDEADEFDCEGSDLDDEDEELEDYGDYDGDYDEDEDSQIFVPTKSVQSRTEISSPQAFIEEEEVKKPGSNRNVRDRSIYVHPVLNPVENLAQWKALKSKGTPPLPLKPQKENVRLEQEAPRISVSSEPIFKHPSFSFKSKSDQPKSQNQEIAVDASLSNWLVTSETTPTMKTRPISVEPISHEQSISPGSNSLVSIEDRPILGALTVEELKQFSASSSPRRSPSRSPDEMAIIGTVGTYWKHTEGGKDSGSLSSYKGIPNTTSKYREDKKVNWHSTPFETRLERALNRRPAEA